MDKPVILPEAPLLTFTARDDEGPDRRWMNEANDVPVLCAAKVWLEPSYDTEVAVRCPFLITTERHRHEPPGMIVERPVIITFVKSVQSNCVAEPDNPTLQVRAVVFKN